MNEFRTQLCLSDVERSHISRTFGHGDLLRDGLESEGDRQLDGFGWMKNDLSLVRSEAAGLNGQFVVARFEMSEAKLSACIRFGVEPSIGRAQFQRGAYHDCPGLILDNPA